MPLHRRLTTPQTKTAAAAAATNSFSLSLALLFSGGRAAAEANLVVGRRRMDGCTLFTACLIVASRYA